MLCLKYQMAGDQHTGNERLRTLCIQDPLGSMYTYFYIGIMKGYNIGGVCLHTYLGSEGEGLVCAL